MSDVSSPRHERLRRRDRPHQQAQAGEAIPRPDGSSSLALASVERDVTLRFDLMPASRRNAADSPPTSLDIRRF
jgi:hypothetical protein